MPRKTHLLVFLTLLIPAVAATPAVKKPLNGPKATSPVPKAFQRSSTSTRNGVWQAISRASRTDGFQAVLLAPKAIVVSKSSKTLTLLRGGKSVKTYPVALGRSEKGPKQRAGDWRTPEGLYYVAQHHPKSRYDRALKISYPNPVDAERGLSRGWITPAQAERIRDASALGILPPQNTKLGYHIEIHGGYRALPGGAGIKGYTQGCVALTNAMMREIYEWAPVGTPVLILPGPWKGEESSS